jgi:hypothetical protein
MGREGPNGSSVSGAKRMGRTILPYRISLEEEIREWRRFVAYLTEEDKHLFEEMMDVCRRYASYAGYAARPFIGEAMLMAILFEQQKQIRQLKKSLERLLTGRQL